MANSLQLKENPWIEKMARVGLIAKGLVYLMVGSLAIMAAFQFNNQSDTDADQKGAFGFIRESPGGPWILAIVALGLLCYSIWRFIQAWTYKDRDAKKVW